MSKERTNEVLLKKYEEKGFAYSLSLCKNLLDSEYLRGKKNKEKVSVVVGEICETLLEIVIKEYIRKGRKWFYSKHFILKDLDNPNSEFLTEIDVVLFTPSKVLVFECKSYKGDKKIVERGTLVRDKNKRFDVYKQHLNHIKVFTRIFDGFRKTDRDALSCYAFPVFMMAPGKMEDHRTQKWKDFLPFVEIRGLVEMLESLDDRDNVWDMQYLRKAVRVIERQKDKYSKRHLDYVKTVNARRK